MLLFLKRWAFILFLAATLPSVALAQSFDVTNMNNRLSRLENEIRTLNQTVYRGQAPSSSSGVSSSSGSMEIRLTQLEEDLRKLTGRIEEIQFVQKKIQESQKKSSEDIDFRLSEIEKKLSAPQTAAALPSIPTSSPAADGLPLASSTPGKESPFPNISSGATTGAAGPDPQKDYNRAYSFILQADYASAETALKDFMARYPEHALAGNAQYWLAETYYVRAMYPEAALAFGEGFEKYPTSQKAADNLLKLGLSLVKLNKKTEACKTFSLLPKSFPDSPESIRLRADQERTRLKCS